MSYDTMLPFTVTPRIHFQGIFEISRAEDNRSAYNTRWLPRFSVDVHTHGARRSSCGASGLPRGPAAVTGHHTESRTGQQYGVLDELTIDQSAV